MHIPTRHSFHNLIICNFVNKQSSQLASASQPIAKVDWSVFDGLYFHTVGVSNNYMLATIIT